MSSTVSSTREIVRKPFFVATTGFALLIVIVWLFAFFIPQGHKLSTANRRDSTLQNQIVSLDQKVAELKATYKVEPQLNELNSRFTKAVPSTADIYPYITQLQDSAKASGVTISSVGQATSGQPTNGITPISLSLDATGTFNQLLSLIKNVDSLPRLTVIESLNIAGGGTTATKSSTLSITLNLTIFTTQPPAIAAS